VKRLLRLYPRAWRQRYGAEVGRMLDDSQAGLREAPDLLAGALDAHLHPGPLGIGTSTSKVQRRAGGLAVLAGLLWLSRVVILFVGPPFDTTGFVDRWQLRPGGIGAVLMVVALGLLMARHVRGRVARSIGAVAFGIAAIGALLFLHAVMSWPSRWSLTGLEMRSAGCALAAFLLLRGWRGHRGALGLLLAISIIYVVLLQRWFTYPLDHDGSVAWDLILWVMVGLAYISIGWAAMREPADAGLAPRPIPS